MRNIQARWIPKLLTEEQKKKRLDVSRHLLQSYQHDKNYLDRIVTGDESYIFYEQPDTPRTTRVWVAPGEATSTRPIRKRFAPKQMLIVFWDKQGILLLEWLPESSTVNTVVYIQTLRKLREAVKKNGRGRLANSVLLQHDNARPHSSGETIAEIRSLGFELMPHHHILQMWHQVITGCLPS